MLSPAYASNTANTAWVRRDHTCYTECPTCGGTGWVTETYTIWTEIKPPPPKGFNAATARWFDVFRTWHEEACSSGLAAQAAKVARRLMHISVAERRRWKRRKWLHATHAL